MNYFVSSRKSTEGTEMSWDVGCVILSNIPSHCFFFFFLCEHELLPREKEIKYLIDY